MTTDVFSSGTPAHAPQSHPTLANAPERSAPASGHDMEMTDFWNASKFIARWKNDTIYNISAKSWMIWNEVEGRWVFDTLGITNERAKNILRSIITDANNLKDEADMEVDKDLHEEKMSKADNMMKWAHNCQNPHRLDSLLTTVKTDPAVAAEQESFDNNEYMFNCTNGTLVFSKGIVSFKKHDRKDKITMSSGVEYDPDAKCPKWEAFVARLFKSRDDASDLIHFVQMALGYCLTGDTSRRKVFLPHGGGNNGKSVLMESISRVFGDYACSLPAESLTTTSRGKIREDLASLVGKRIVRVSEAQRGAVIDEEIVKKLSGGSDPMYVRNLYERSFEFKPACKIFWYCNHLPTIMDCSPSIRGRLRAIPFNETFAPEEIRSDVEITSEHEKERSGILNWLIEGYKAMANDMKAFDKTPGVMTLTNEYMEEANDINRFIADCCDVHTPDSPPDVPYSANGLELFNAYQLWATQNGILRPMTMTRFGSDITTVVGRENKIRGERGVRYSNIRIKSSVANIHYISH